MDANEIRRELERERAQGLVDEVAAAAVANRHVLLVRGEVVDVVDRYQPQVLAQPRTDLRPATSEPGALRDPEQLRHGETSRLADRLGELLATHGFQQVPDRLGLEGLEGVLVVCGREDHRGWLLEHGEMPRGLDPVHARHADVEQDHVGIELLTEPERLQPVGRFTHYRDLAQLLEQTAQPLARRRLVVDDDRTHRFGRAGGVGLAHDRVGILRRTTCGCHGGPAVSSSTSGNRRRTRNVSPPSSTSTALRPG